MAWIRAPLAAVLAGVVAVAAAAAAAAIAADDPPPGSVVEAPRPLDPRDVGIGELVPDADVALVSGETRKLSELAGPKGLVVVVRSESCPVGRRQGPSVASIEKDAAAAGFGVVLLNVAPRDGAAAASAAAKDYGFTAPYALDASRRVAALLGVRSTTDCFVLDRARTLRYRGALDDQIGLGYALAAPRHAYLRRAIEAVAAGRRPLDEATTAPGCVVEIPAAPPTAVAPAPAPTWHARISRIVDRHCVDCHREGEAGPFPLVTRDDVLGQAEMVKFVVERRSMPPWFASKEHGAFATDRSLSDRDRRDLLAWLGAGGPEGDARDAAVPIVREKGWRIGKPDLVLEGQEFDVPAAGVVDYQYHWIEASADEDRWVKALEVRPSAREVVHHVLVFARFRKKDERARSQAPFDGGITGYFAAAVPGADCFVFPDGMAKKWPAGTDLYVQVHYTPNGRAVKDRPSIGIVLAKGPPREEVRTRGVFDAKFTIPPGAARHEVSAAWVLPQAGRIFEMMPHMHLRGTAFRYEIETPDGKRRTLLDIPRYDFEWQVVYRLREPIDVPKGTRVIATGWFDNSAKNPANPDPSRLVPFGEQTSDEMMIGYFDWVPAAE